MNEMTDVDQYIDQYIIKSLDEQRAKTLANMTAERAVAYIKEAGEICGDHDHLSAEFTMNLIAEWTEKQAELRTEAAGNILAVRGAIIDALAGGHLDGPDASGYAKSVLAQIADLLDIKLPAALKAANGLH